MKNITLLRLKHTAKLESLIEEGAPYELILKESKKIDKLIIEELKARGQYCGSDDDNNDNNKEDK